MAGCKAAGRVVGVLLAVAALLAAAAATMAAADDDHMQHWNCFKSCTKNCHGEAALDDDVANKDGVLNNVHGGVVSGKCKTGCLHKCFQDPPALCYQQCVVKTCLSCHPPHGKEKVTCMKNCCDKCFHHHGPKHLQEGEESSSSRG